MFFVRQQVLRQPVGSFDRGRDQLIAAQTQHQPLPIHIVAPKPIGQSPERHAKAPQKQGFLHRLGLARHVRQHPAGYDRIHLTAA
jgi:hypothetical protein